MKVAPACAKKDPREAKLRRGASGARSKPPCVATDRREEQGPEGGRAFLGDRVKPGVWGRGVTTRGQRRVTSSRGFLPGETPEERTLDVAAG